MSSRLSMISSDSKITLVEFCAKLVKKIDVKKQQSSDEESKVLLSLYGDQCNAVADEISKLSDECGQHPVVKQLQTIAKLVLDVTYVEECELVEQNEIQASTWQRVRGILDTLSSVEKLASKALPTRELTSTLGEDIVECLWWRKGALLYMYCHMAQDNKKANVPPHYLKCLEEGVDYFLSMLCARSTPYWLGGDEGEEEVKNDKKNLLQEGIWSDNHLLALMYCGEMCYWHTERSQLAKTSPEEGLAQLSLGASEGGASSGGKGTTVASSNDIDILKTGQVCLDKFVTIAHWPMLKGSWNTKRAEELLAYLAKC